MTENIPVRQELPVGYAPPAPQPPYPGYPQPSASWGGGGFVPGPSRPKSSGFRIAAGIVSLAMIPGMYIAAMIGLSAPAGLALMGILLQVAFFGDLICGIVILVKRRSRRRGAPVTLMCFAGFTLLLAIVGTTMPYFGPVIILFTWLTIPVLIIMGLGLSHERHESRGSGPGQGWPGALDPRARPEWVQGQVWAGPYQGMSSPVSPGRRPPIGPDAPVYNWFIALIVGLPVVDVLLQLAWSPAFRFRYVGHPPVRVLDPASVFTPTYFLLAGAGILIYGASVVLAYFDWLQLGRSGVVRPFHWAWAFLGVAVYVTGRSVIVHQVAHRRGLAPVWALIGVIVVALIISAARASAMFSDLVTALPPVT